MRQGLFVGIPEYVRITIYSQTRKLLATSFYQRDNDTEDIVQDLLLFYLEKFYKKKEFNEAYVVTSLKNEAKRLIRVRVCKCSGLFLSLDDMETCPDELQISGCYEQSELNLLFSSLDKQFTEQEKQIVALIKSGASLDDVARKIHVSKSTIYRFFEKVRKNVKK